VYYSFDSTSIQEHYEYERWMKRRSVMSDVRLKEGDQVTWHDPHGLNQQGVATLAEYKEKYEDGPFIISAILGGGVKIEGSDEVFNEHYFMALH